jgi:hypothetical protein
VLRVDLAPAEGQDGHGVPEALGRRAYHLVGSCLLPGDVILPRFLRPGSPESYFAVAATDGAGLRSLCGRIRDQLAAWPELREAGITASVRGTLVEWSARDRAKPGAIAEAAREVERWTQIDADWSE